MDIIEVGRSELVGRTLGVMQTLERGAGLQAIGFMNEVQRLTGYRLTVNEGRRSRADQRLVWNAWQLFLSGLGPWAPRAAPPYTSIHDEILHGNAVDFGGPGGEVIPQHVHDVMVQIGPRFGIVWTGNDFGEWWHFEVRRGAATEQVPEGIVRTGTAAAAPAHQEQEEDDMGVYMGKDVKGNIYVYDVGRRTKWNIIKGLKTVAQATQRLKLFQSHGIKYVGNVTGVEVAAFRDITDNNTREGL